MNKNVRRWNRHLEEKKGHCHAAQMFRLIKKLFLYIYLKYKIAIHNEWNPVLLLNESNELKYFQNKVAPFFPSVNKKINKLTKDCCSWRYASMWPRKLHCTLEVESRPFPKWFLYGPHHLTRSGYTPDGYTNDDVTERYRLLKRWTVLHP